MLDGNKVTKQDCIDAVTDICFDVLGDGKTTVCTLTLYNGFTVRGSASCVDPAEFNEALGKQYSEEEAREGVWPVLGAILAEKLYRARQPAEDPVPRTDAEKAAQIYLDLHAAHELSRDETERAFKARNEAASVLLKLIQRRPMMFGGYVLRQSSVSWAVDIEKVHVGEKLP